MKRFMKKMVSIMVALAMVMTVFAPLMGDDAQAATKKVKLSKTKMTMYVGKTAKLKMLNTGKKVKWSSGNKKVATVNRYGKVTAKKAGKATITAKVAGKKYRCKVVVKKPHLNYKKVTIKAGKTKTLKLYGTKIKAAYSSNKKVATISKTGKVRAKKVGKATITVKGTNKKTYKCVVTVVAAKKGATVSFNNTYWNMNFGQSLGTQFTARFHADGTILAYSAGSDSFSEGTYRYTNGKLFVSLEWWNNVEFKQVGDRFQSVQKYSMQAGEDYYKISPTAGTYFLERYEAVY